MEKLLLLGDEAIAQGAIDAGLSGIFGYPGTPSTEITEYVQGSKEAKEKGIRSAWASNEKTAMEAALGMSYAGKRVMFTCKHVGMNVAADAFMNSAITGVNGGAIFIAADDPSMHSSQNEQDSRFWGYWSMVPVLEPSNQQEAYDMVHYGFELSEKFRLPVILRVTTRLAHSRAGVNIRRNTKKQNEVSIPNDPKQFILLPVNARNNYRSLIAKQDDLLKASEEDGFNQYFDADNKTIGIIACGLSYNYLMENFSKTKCPYPILKVVEYPMPINMVNKLYEQCDSILVLEEGQPLYEGLLKGLLNKGKKIMGRLDGTISRDGELSPALVGKALGLEVKEGLPIPSLVSPRPPKLCDGCPHIDTYKALNDAVASYSKGRVFSDIGCYTLGALPPYNAISTTVDMGASITMAKGASEAGYTPTIAVIGDSTFTHSGMTGLLDCVVDNTPITIVILDNSITAMTGSQKSSATGRIESICEGIGVAKEHIRVITPLKKFHDENVKVFQEEISYQGVSVIIPRRECLVWANKKRKEAKNNQQ
ncbi:MAG: indolepyruvate ferredoxin oxidoreductase [Bacteroidales bacterium]|jgi:indolepyruvate ferredoxin oxidoreductase alpha subunit|nr:indolepyruvate ferredoxin oxidoreductase [Bacteroidales bacterium]